MKKEFFFLCGAALGLALLATGCETTDISARIQEKSASFATAKTWEKSFIQKGVIATGFTPDMVYMALGNPTKVVPVRIGGEGQGEMWIFSNYYPAPDARRMDTAPFTTEENFQPSPTEGKATDNQGTVNGPNGYSGAGSQVPRGMGRSNQSIATTGAPQGGSMEPADLQAFTLQVIFQSGHATRIGIKRN